MDTRFLTLAATHEELSYFPIDKGNNSYKILAHEYERMSEGQTHDFDSHVQVWIPEGYSGRITTDTDEDFQVQERVLGGNKWHRLNFTVTYQGTNSPKIYGERGLAVLIVSKCE